MSYKSMTVTTAMRKIESKELILPAIQRDFVWSPGRIYGFLDSLMRGYPFGTLLFWNTSQRVQYREFDRDRSKDSHYAFLIKERGNPGTMVLDGQQRLQSLYLSLYGSLDGRHLHFDVLSGVDPQDASEAKYRFEFMAAQRAEERNRQQQGQRHWVRLGEIHECPDIPHRRQLVRTYIAQSGVDADSSMADRLAENVEIAYSKLKAEEILNHYTVDPNYGAGGTSTSIDEILEIFVRINSGGQVLSKSDLMFSLMQLHWEGAAESIDELLDELGEIGGGFLDFDKDFVLRCALVCCGRGARYSVDKLRDVDTVDKIKSEFPRIVEALRSCVDFLVRDARILDSRVLGSYNTLIPFVYLIYRQRDQRFQSEAMRREVKYALYLSLMTSLFSRYAESRIDKFIREVLDPALQISPTGFPLDEFCAFAEQREGRAQIDDWLLQRNVRLLMNILEGGTILPVGRRRHRPEVDHIFPASKLREAEYPEDQVNHFANFRLISKRDNIWKSNQDPKPYFESNPGVAEQYLIPTDLLDYDRYVEFLSRRREMIWERVQAFLGGPIPDPPVDEKSIDRWEQQLRDLIDRRLSETMGQGYWKQAIPGQVQQSIKERINHLLSVRPEKSWQDYAAGKSRLAFCDVSDYETIVLAKANWPLFKGDFGKRGEFERHISAVRRFRNTVKHGRPVDEVEKMGAEAGLLWFQRVLDAIAPVSLPEEPATAEPGAQTESDTPAPEDYHRLLTRIPVPRGQQQLYKALYDVGDQGLTHAELIVTMGRRDMRALAGVLGALGKRVNGTPGYGKAHKPATNMVLDWKQLDNGQWQMRLKPEMRKALERLNPDWLHTMTR